MGFGLSKMRVRFWIAVTLDVWLKGFAIAGFSSLCGCRFLNSKLLDVAFGLRVPPGRASAASRVQTPKLWALTWRFMGSHKWGFKSEDRP